MSRAAEAILSRAEAEDFLFEEARLIDEGHHQAWLDLFTADGIYWLPINADAAPTEHLSLILDDTHRREERVYRLRQTQFPAQSPSSQTLHVVSNIQVRDGITEELASGEVTLFSSQIIHEIRGGSADDRQLGLGDQRTFAGRAEHRLRRVDGVWRMSLKRLVLLNRRTPIPNLTFLL
jgi:3-phenylpropionate/cinnamic acid dioxygenase small subunit